MPFFAWKAISSLCLLFARLRPRNTCTRSVLKQRIRTKLLIQIHYAQLAVLSGLIYYCTYKPGVSTLKIAHA